MNRRYLTIAPLVMVLLQASCTQAPPPPAPDTRAADEKTIRDTEAQWLKDENAKDLDKDVSYYADGGSLLMPNMPILTGKDAIRAVYKEEAQDPNFSIDSAPSKVEVSRGGDLAYSQGSYTVTFTNPKTKKTMTEKGKYVEVYKKQADGAWKVVEDMTNSDGPAIPAK